MKSKTIFVRRQKTLKTQLSQWGVDCYLCDNPTDIFYLTGMQLSLGRLLINSRSVTLFVDGRYYETAKTKACCNVKKMAEKEVLNLLSSSAWKDVRVVGFDTSTSYIRVEKFKKQLQTLRKTRRLKTPYRMKGLVRPIQHLRAIKDASELSLIEKSAQLLWKGFLHAKKQLKVGVEEREIALEFEFYCRKLGAEGMSFTPIVAFGAGSALPHYPTGKRKLKKGDIVLMDLGVRLNGYASDMTRTFFFGEGKKELTQLFHVVKEAKQAALDLCRPGVPLSKLDEAARKVMRKARLEKHFLHSLGHGIGLDVHESPNFRTDDTELTAGMVITIEPGLYLPGKGGVRLEDMVVITKTGHRNLFR
ncbi:M24 family metallopeptidase [Simkania sp.]|uniref:M24 family metallopeptidase n=1 Tax=Simkania sp. TaxID=34094 RepID=UPI003B52706E